MVTANGILDNMGLTLNQMAYLIRFDLLDASNNVLGQVHPLTASSVVLNTASTIMRSISGVSLTVNEMNDIDPFNYRIRPKMCLGDGSEWPLGVFIFSNQVDLIADGVYPVNLTLTDLSGELDQQSLETISFPAGFSILQAITQMLDVNRIIIRDIPSGDTVPIGPAGITWPAGTSKLKIIQELCTLGGYLPAYFNNDGTLIVRRHMPNIDADFAYTTMGGKIIAGSLKYASNLLASPNAYLVIDTAPSAGPISAIAYVDPGLAWSKENRGGRIYPQVTRTQGLSSIDQAQTMANGQAASSGTGFQVVTFNTTPDPRHDLFQNIQFDGNLYRETGSTFSLTFGAAQTHAIARGGFGAG